MHSFSCLYFGREGLMERRKESRIRVCHMDGGIGGEMQK